MTSIEHQQIEYARASCIVIVNEVQQIVLIEDGGDTIAYLDGWRYDDWQERISAIEAQAHGFEGADADYLAVYRYYLPH